MVGEAQDKPGDRHILSRFDGDLGEFHRIVLEMGQRVRQQVMLAGEALAVCDVAKARTVIGNHGRVLDLDMQALEVNAGLYAIHQPVARDLRFVLMLSRTVYDLEHIGGEAVRLAHIAEHLYECQPAQRGGVMFEDVRRMMQPAVSLLDNSILAIATDDTRMAVEVVLKGKELNELFEGAVRRLATYLMEDPRNIGRVIDATLGIKAMERVGDHACSIARNVIYSVTGRDVRHVNVASLAID